MRARMREIEGFPYEGYNAEAALPGAWDFISKELGFRGAEGYLPRRFYFEREEMDTLAVVVISGPPTVVLIYTIGLRADGPHAIGCVAIPNATPELLRAELHGWQIP